ncbi:MAG: hypothetical protein WCF36_01255 [Candidatus Nanopelagicales bacterium]
MANEILMTVALPHGGKPNDVGRLSVYLAPRGRGAARLSDTDWGDWPAVVGARTFTVTIDGNTVPANQVSVVSPAPDSAVWAAVFAADMPWNTWQFTDRRDRAYLSLDEGDVHEDIVAAYLAVGEAFPTTIPTVSDLRGLPDVADLLGPGGVARERLRRARQFSTRSPGSTGDGGGQGVDTIDFNQAVSLLGRHPHLLRVLGIVVDLEVKLPATFSRVSVHTDITNRIGNTVREISPQTCLNPDFWSHGGFEDLSAARLTQIDVLNAAGTLSEFVRTFAETDGPAPLPSLADFGVAITRTDAPGLLQDRALRMTTIEREINRLLTGQIDVMTLCDADLVIGHRIDVSLPGKPFRSLHQRVSANGYLFPRDPALKVSPDPDENWVSTTLGTETTNTITQQRARPVLHRWSGWSAAAPPAGNVLDPLTGEAVETKQSAPAPGPVQFTVDYQVQPGTLPRLRYGSQYWLRARQVDISGVSRDVTDSGGSERQPPPIDFGRWSAVASPSLVRRQLAPVPGVDDTPTQLVIKSELDSDDATLPPTDRLIFPPVGTQQLAERHGLPAGGADPGAYADLAERDGRSLTNDTTADPVTAERIVLSGPIDGDPTPPGPDQVAVSYLPDPAATGIGFAGVPGVPGVLVVPWRGSWPELSTQRLILAAGPPSTTLVDADDAVEVRLPKAGWIDVEIGCSVKAPFTDHFGLVAVMREGRPAGEVTQLDRVLADGRFWLVSARKTVTLIHAVRVPLAIPAITSLRAERRLEGRQARLFGRLNLDRASTRRVTLRGSWTDPVDDPSEDGPRDAAAQVLIGKVSVDREGRPRVVEADLQWRLDDTRHREVLVTAEAFSRFSRHFTEQRTIEVPDSPTAIVMHNVVISSVVVSDGERTYSEGTDYLVDGPTGTLTRIEGGGLTVGSQVTVRWIPNPTSRLSQEDGAEPFLLEVPNTRPPLPPKVLETLPAFRRRRNGDERSQRIHHHGSVVRVWLGRGWFVSGAGELLGVVCDVAGAQTVTTSVAGKDPVFLTSDPAPITPELLTSAVTASAGLTTLDGRPVDVAGHQVTFDTDTGRWYADVVIDDDGTYLPFVRLVLCRLQPHSVTGAHLSSLIATDPLRLGPTRTTTVRVAERGATLRVTMQGASHDGVADPDPDQPDVAHHNRVTAWVEERDPGVADPDLGWSVLDGPVRLERLTSGQDTSWRHDFVLPIGGFDTDAEIRVRLEESEPLLSGSADTRPSITHKPVFVETVAVPPSAFVTQRRPSPQGALGGG